MRPEDDPRFQFCSVIMRKQMSVDSFLQRPFGFPNLHCAVTDRKKPHTHTPPQEKVEQKQLIIKTSDSVCSSESYHDFYSNDKKNFNEHVFLTHSEAVNSWLLLVARPLMGLSCPRTSPRGASESACQRRSSPPLHPLSSTEEPGTTPRALTQSAWALAVCWRKQFILYVRSNCCFYIN